MDQSAINAIADLAIEANKTALLDTDTPAIILKTDDGGQTIASLESFQPGRSRLRGTYATSRLRDFADFVIQQVENDATLAGKVRGFIDPDKMTAQVFFNLGDAEHPGHADFIAKLALKPTAAYAALGQILRQGKLTQTVLHDFVEDWRDNIIALYDGQPTDKPLASALAAIRDVTIEKARQVRSVERDMGATLSAMESVDAKSDLQLPSHLLFRTAPYDGLQEVVFGLRLGANTASDAIALTLRLQQAEKVGEDITEDFHNQLQAALGTASSLSIGTFNP